MDKKKILIVEDDKDISMIEEMYLNVSGFETVVLTDGLTIKEELQKESFDLIILDLMLPGKSGYDICQEMREMVDIPILMVTARGETMDKIKGFDVGADDYIAKPFDPAELVARVKANIRQSMRYHKEETQDELMIGNLKILLKSRRVYKNNQEIILANKEFELLKFLALNPNIVFSKEDLFEKIWGYDYMGDSATVTVHINRLREKIEDDSKNPKILETVWGAGYRLKSL